MKTKTKTKDWERDKIIMFCSRCGIKYCKLGKVLEWGKHYPAYTVKFKGGRKKDYPADDEIKKAVCRNCAKELFDNQLLNQQAKDILATIEKEKAKIFSGDSFYTFEAQETYETLMRLQEEIKEKYENTR